jgi:hypothetical protein
MAELSALQRSTMDTSDQWFTLDSRRDPIWGSRGREFKSRQPDHVVRDAPGRRQVPLPHLRRMKLYAEFHRQPDQRPEPQQTGATHLLGINRINTVEGGPVSPSAEELGMASPREDSPAPLPSPTELRAHC